MKARAPSMLRFLGGAGTVTGSRFLLTIGGKRILVDCGLFQGLKELRLRNWDTFPLDPKLLDAIILTHAHLDHSGYIPLLCRDGFHGPIFATRGTVDLCRILLPDSGHLQEEEANYANRAGYSKHSPARPLYTEEDAWASMERFEAAAFRHAGRYRARNPRDVSLGRPYPRRGNRESRSRRKPPGAGFSSAATWDARVIRFFARRRPSRMPTWCWSNRPMAIGSTMTPSQFAISKRRSRGPSSARASS